MAVELSAATAEQTRARYPDESGCVDRDGVNLYYELYGTGEPTVFLLPTWSVIHSRQWKMQIPYLARHCRVLTFDGRGNGRSDRPATGYDEREFAADALAVMDATATERAALVSLSLGAQRALILAGEQPERVEGAVFICPRCRSPSRCRSGRSTPGTTSSTRATAGRSTTATTGCGTTTASSSSSSPHVHRAALDEADRGLRRLGARDDAGDPDREPGAADVFGAPHPGRESGRHSRQGVSDARSNRSRRSDVHDAAGSGRGQRVGG